MGLFSRLQQNIAANYNPNEPLFGGLIPRRYEEEPRMIQASRQSINQAPVMNVSAPISRRSTSRAEALAQPTSNEPFGGREVKFDWTEQELKAKNRALDLEGQRLGMEGDYNRGRLGIAGRQADIDEAKERREGIKSKDEMDINHRKQALDEWKARNPEGELKIDENGKVHVIDKRSGATIDTGITADHFTEKEKLNLQQKHNIDLEGLRQRNRLDLEKEKNRTILPSQQRTAEDDAARELLRDERYRFLVDNGIMSVGENGIEIKDKNNKWKDHIKEFNKELKTKTEERMNRSNSNNNSDKRTVRMIDPRDGSVMNVPEDEVEEVKKHLENLGVGEKKEQFNYPELGIGSNFTPITRGGRTVGYTNR